MSPGRLHWFWLLWLYTAHAAGTELIPLFHIAKSDSRNEVHYAASLGPDCRFAADPVRVFWLRRADPGRPPRPLDWTEETFAYGVRLLQADPGASASRSPPTTRGRS